NEEARRDALVRSRMITAIRAYLDDEKFVEVETPILQPRYGGAFAEPFVTHSNYLDQDVYLRIADELYLKRLIVGGLERAYQRAKLEAAGVDTSHDRTWAQLVDHAYSHFVEPELVQPTFVHDWPLELSPFARRTDDDPAMVERFECVVGGMEFGNAFSELNDS